MILTIQAFLEGKTIWGKTITIKILKTNNGKIIDDKMIYLSCFNYFVINNFV